MAKPSIFSRDYERRIRKRRRRIAIAIAMIVLVVGIVFVKFKLPSINFSEVKSKIQAWVDTGKTVDDDIEEIEEEEEIEEAEPEIVERTFIDFNIQDGVVVKAEYVDENGDKKFIGLEPVEGYTFSLSPSQHEMIIIDANQNLNLLNVDGTFKDVTKKEYISTKNQPYPKDQMLAANEGYIWHASPTFIDENKMIYISQLPFFGNAATNKYVWIKDLSNNTDAVLWGTKGNEIQIGELDAEKGRMVTIDGNVKYINANGEISQ